MFLSLWSNIVGKLSSNITIYRLVGTELNGIKKLNWLCKHMKNVRRSQPCISMIFFSKHKFFHVSIVNRQINGQRASVFTFEKGQRGTRLSDSRKIPLRKIAPPSPNSNANRKPNPDPDRGAIFRTPFGGRLKPFCINLLKPIYH